METKFVAENDISRKILHIDMDAFFAAVEERDHPQLRGKPVVIARHPRETGGRGVVTTANYAARAYGIHSAMSAHQAYKLCPHAVFIPGDYFKYREISQDIRQIFFQYTDKVEPLSIDEAYLDVTENKANAASATSIARHIQRDIWRSVSLTCSAGVSYNKFLAKIASDFKKPRGLTVIVPRRAVDFLKALPIEKFHGVGKKTALRMKALGIFTGEDLYQWDEAELIEYFGKYGSALYRRVRGIHSAPVETERVRKSVGNERTFDRSLTSQDSVFRYLYQLAEKVDRSLAKADKHAKTVVLKVRYADYTTLTKQITVPQGIRYQEELYLQAKKLWEKNFTVNQGIRLLGITASNLAMPTEEPQQLMLWD